MSTLNEYEAWSYRLAAHLSNVRIIPDYSGRGMRGKTCVGIVYEHPVDLVNFGASYGTAHGRMPSELVGERSFHDEFGKGFILYFPDVQWPKGCPANEENEDD